MRRSHARQPGTYLARCTRRLGFDRNPLRRRTDRVEAVLRLVTMILFLVAVPLAAVAVGQQVDHLGLRYARAQYATEHTVRAVLLRRASVTGDADPYASIPMTYALARWQPPGRPPRSGQVLARAGAPAGSTVTVWIDASGALVSPPLDHREITDNVTIAVAVAIPAASLLVLGSSALARRALDRRRLSAWDAEWRATGPLWSGRRG